MEAKEWFKAFSEESSRSFARDNITELGACRLRHWKRKEVPGCIRGDEWDSHNAEWTAVMGSFLARMADSLGMTQEWEWAPTTALRRSGDVPPAYTKLLSGTRGVDFAWFADAASRPSVIIEHENDVTKNEGKGITDEVGKLVVRLPLCPDDSLAVLITYPWEGHARYDTKDVLESTAAAVARTPRPEGRLLLVLGDTGEPEWMQLSWSGLLWNGDGWSRI